MTTTNTLPLDKISEALDVLQNHGVIGDDEADHALGCFLEENDLTDDDLNSYQPDIASEDAMLPLVKSILQTYECDVREMAWSLAFSLTDGGRVENLEEVLGDFADTEEG